MFANWNLTDIESFQYACTCLHSAQSRVLQVIADDVHTLLFQLKLTVLAIFGSKQTTRLWQLERQNSRNEVYLMNWDCVSSAPLFPVKHLKKRELVNGNDTTPSHPPSTSQNFLLAPPRKMPTLLHTMPPIQSAHCLSASEFLECFLCKIPPIAKWNSAIPQQTLPFNGPASLKEHSLASPILTERTLEQTQLWQLKEQDAYWNPEGASTSLQHKAPHRNSEL